MSNVIPIVSSSPPPLDEGPSFEEAPSDDWDDFEEFTSASGQIPLPHATESGAFFQPIKPVDNITARAWSETSDLHPGSNHVTSSDDWANFNSSDGHANDYNVDETEPGFIENTSTSQVPPGPVNPDVVNCNGPVASETCGGENVEIALKGHSPPCPKQDTVSSPESPTSVDDVDFNGVSDVGAGRSRTKAESQEVVSQGSVTDSGISGDLSPGHKRNDSDDFADFSLAKENKGVHSNKTFQQQEQTITHVENMELETDGESNPDHGESTPEQVYAAPASGVNDERGGAEGDCSHDIEVPPSECRERVDADSEYPDDSCTPPQDSEDVVHTSGHINENGSTEHTFQPPGSDLEDVDTCDEGQSNDESETAPPRVQEANGLPSSDVDQEEDSSDTEFHSPSHDPGLVGNEADVGKATGGESAAAGPSTDHAVSGSEDDLDDFSGFCDAVEQQPSRTVEGDDVSSTPSDIPGLQEVNSVEDTDLPTVADSHPPTDDANLQSQSPPGPRSDNPDESSASEDDFSGFVDAADTSGKAECNSSDPQGDEEEVPDVFDAKNSSAGKTESSKQSPPGGEAAGSGAQPSPDEEFTGFMDTTAKEETAVELQFRSQSFCEDDDDLPGKSDDDEFSGLTGAATVAEDTGDWSAFGEPATDAAPPAESESDSWAAFGDAAPKVESETGDGDWAAFGDPVVAPSDDRSGDFKGPDGLDLDSGDEDFGDFADTSVPVDVAQSDDQFNRLKAQGKTGGVVLVESVFQSHTATRGAPPDVESGSLETAIQKEVAYRDETVPPPQTRPGSVSQPYKQKEVKPMTIDVNVWNNLKNMDKTVALNYLWGTSLTSQKMLKAVGVDKRNILVGVKKAQVPIFYQPALLEPSRSPSGSILEPSLQTPTVTIPEPNSRSPGAVTMETSPGPSPVMTPTSATGPVGVSTPLQDIPPAEFDWSSSGLTNPLDASSSLQLDLDFFTQNDRICSESALSARSSEVLQKEHEILQAIDPSKSEPPKTLQPLETILATMNFTPTAPPSASRQNEDGSRSAEASRVLNALTDLSFMTATVLMFPVKGEEQEGEGEEEPPLTSTATFTATSAATSTAGGP